MTKLSDFTLTWLPTNWMSRELRKVAKAWPETDTVNADAIGLILLETWSAVQRLQPFPKVCVLHTDGVIAGIW